MPTNTSKAAFIAQGSGLLICFPASSNGPRLFMEWISRHEPFLIPKFVRPEVLADDTLAVSLWLLYKGRFCPAGKTSYTECLDYINANI